MPGGSELATGKHTYVRSRIWDHQSWHATQAFGRAAGMKARWFERKGGHSPQTRTQVLIWKATIKARQGQGR